jgi:DNA repair protein RadC
MNISKQKLLLIKEKDFEYNKKICSTLDLVDFMRNSLNINNEAQEVVYLLSLNNKNQLVSFIELARGGLNMCNVSQNEIFKNVLLSNSNKFILAHNHPSGDPTPSESDIEVTKDILKGAKTLNINFLDHLVIGDDEYMSCMKDLKR